MNIRIFATAVLFSMSSFAAAQELTQEEMARVSEKLQLKEAANQARDFALAFKAFAGQFGEDIVERTAPFNAAAAAKYSAEYSIRALVSPKLEEEFGLVAGNLAYDAVAEAADAAELAAEIAALAKGRRNGRYCGGTGWILLLTRPGIQWRGARERRPSIRPAPPESNACR